MVQVERLETDGMDGRWKNGRFRLCWMCTDGVISLTLRLLMSYIHGTPILDVSKSHTTTQHSR